MLPVDGRQLENVKGELLKLKKKEAADCQLWHNVARTEERKKQKNKEKRIRFGGNVTFTLETIYVKKIGGGLMKISNKKTRFVKEYLHFLEKVSDNICLKKRSRASEKIWIRRPHVISLLSAREYPIIQDCPCNAGSCS
ncbi:hypothetical protein AVEN_272916-1 [Araneus ventricosus]|uniref:Uncharacterized protein n=1 Tax=Araneus ventricosus TaxID=182803 RepID=A0A4Y2CHZ5_ARAVE|nr:hypothetical protein AVEN_272916-1 [Araneus ventricosus]